MESRLFFIIHINSQICDQVKNFNNQGGSLTELTTGHEEFDIDQYVNFGYLNQNTPTFLYHISYK